MAVEVVEDLDGFGDLGDAVWGAGRLVEDRPGFESGEHALNSTAW
ncbi:hypothetical protein O1R50_08240 [Glycomyces luteolus]|uniref:Uncharacterized protein n=1 Tax=Glycomyces luteolus TaxID=2670330 RepID=A0A9X3SSW0_9ACTN|nr:hypothetical protein [Glycomyces luteolus]MDA1359608.1 hypothetical protein [Glycomyces luteolus]